ncbi:MAG: hypothetical protein K9L68_03810 [Spirochaetales bacterium]|nr:hypothetical protein [Spirochaetales bacterium]MCF7937705.1 hypothetical protein [Spirochaetales bacterium]
MNRIDFVLQKLSELYDFNKQLQAYSIVRKPTAKEGWEERMRDRRGNPAGGSRRAGDRE